MLSVNDAIADILNIVKPRAPQLTKLSIGRGLILAEEVIADIDSPPFDKSAMDGYAIRSVDIENGISEFKCLEEVMAGQVATRSVGKGEAIAIMTGAPVPTGADAVVQIELTSFDDATNHVSINTKEVFNGLNILPQGMAMKRGDIIFSPGRLLRPQEMGALAELGKAELLISKRPTIAVLATGDELVNVAEKPGPAQIRNSNETMLVAQINRADAIPIPLGIAKDDRDHLKAVITNGLNCDILLLSGGVSAGKLDLVPSVLQELGISERFHKVALKPGKPIWFGVGKKLKNDDDIYVFGLPGNPVGSLVCFELFVRMAIRRFKNFPNPQPVYTTVIITTDWQCKGDREVFHPAQLIKENGKLFVTPLSWQGSADLQATQNANCMIHFPAGNTMVQEGEVVEVIEWVGDE